MLRKLQYGLISCLLIWTAAACAGCMDIVELRSEAFLIGIGIDTTDSAGEVEVSVVEVQLSPAQAGMGSMDEGSGKGSGQYRVITSKGKSLADGLRDIRMKLQKKLVLSKITYVVFSEEAAHRGIQKELDFFARAYDFDQTAHLFISKGKAVDLLKVDGGKLLDFTTKGFSFLPAYIGSEFWRIGIKMNNNGLESAFINRINITKGVLSFEGESYMLRDKLAYNMKTRDSKFVNILLSRQSEGLFLSAQDSDETMMELSSLKRTIKYQPKHVQLNYKFRVWVIESGMRTTIQDKARIELAAAKRIETKLNQLVQETKVLGIDMLGIGEKFRQRNWNTNDWEQQIKKLDIDIKVKVTILSGSGKSDFEK